MKYRGINYDIGTKTITGGITRETFDINIIAKEIEIIRKDLHCNAIRISGLDIDRIALAAELALKEGLTVWFSPALHYDNRQNTLQYIIEGARAAEKLRRKYNNIIYIVGCELTLFTAGFVKGETGEERTKSLFSPFSMVKNMLGISRSYNRKLNEFLTAAVSKVKQQFTGQISYASGTWEKVDWKLFDIVGIDHYRAAYNKAVYVKQLQEYKKIGKPISIMEFGCCTYKGAEEKGPMGWAIVDWKKEKPELKGDYVRSEDTQARYMLELLDIFEKEDVLAAFVFTFILNNYKYCDNPKYDLDMASYGLVKPMGNGDKKYYSNLPWLPKLAFMKLAEHYAKWLPVKQNA